jgi:hypothetical protein
MFLADKIGFYDIYDLVSRAVEAVPFIENPTLEQILEADRLAREAADPTIREYAENVLRNWRIYTRQDLRAWNYTDYVALQILEQWPARPDTVLLPKT